MGPIIIGGKLAFAVVAAAAICLSGAGKEVCNYVEDRSFILDLQKSGYVVKADEKAEYRGVPTIKVNQGIVDKPGTLRMIDYGKAVDDSGIVYQVVNGPSGSRYYISTQKNPGIKR